VDANMYIVFFIVCLYMCFRWRSNYQEGIWFSSFLLNSSPQSRW